MQIMFIRRNVYLNCILLDLLKFLSFLWGCFELWSGSQGHLGYYSLGLDCFFGCDGLLSKFLNDQLQILVLRP